MFRKLKVKTLGNVYIHIYIYVYVYIYIYIYVYVFIDIYMITPAFKNVAI